jgi:FlaA1/EpsC-like NDP-sugar epimerase
MTRQKIAEFIFEKNTPRWIIFFIDLGICVFSLLLAYLLRFNFSIPPSEVERFDIIFPFAIAVRAVSFFIAKIHHGVIRYTGSKDAQSIFTVCTLTSLFMLAANLFNVHVLKNELFLIPTSIVIIDYLTATFLLISLRVLFKVLYFEWKNPSRTKTSVIIFGAGESGIITKRTLDRDAGTKYKVLAFIDDDPKKAGKKLEGVAISGFDRLEDLLRENAVAHVIISIQNLSPKRKEEIVDMCLTHHTKILNVPPVSSWINGELSFKQIKKVKIEELLERDPIKLDEENIGRQIRDKTILITGAAGSIGSELARQVSRYNPAKLILLDISESPLYEIEMELSEKFHIRSFEVVIGDVRNAERMENVFRTFRPHVVFHSAAYKHVPMMENNPSESILTNVLGTKVTADLSIKYQAEKFVMISTDKAVNPSNVMGASKRIAEIYCQSLNNLLSHPSFHADHHQEEGRSDGARCKFITTRFGNVLGSSGSVIQRFRQQIERGGPVTVTHPEVTRFFMTIPEACQLVLEAAAMGNGGEVFIFDMGKSVRIHDLARKMIQLSGLALGKDIQIVFTGLRPGEKLYEELLSNHENAAVTHHPQIMIARVREYDFEIIAAEIDRLVNLFDTQDNMAIVKKMKQIVPEFRSNNSVFEKLDIS